MDTDSPAISTARRRVIGAGLVGLLGSLVAASRATAAPDESTTTSPPRQPTRDDVGRLAFAQQLEVAAVELYDTAIALAEFEDERIREVFSFIQRSHVAYAQTLSALLGGDANDEPLEDLVTSGRSGFETRDVTELARAAAELENALVASHIAAVGELQAYNGARLLASIVPIESRFAAVLLSIAGEDDLDALLVDTAEPLAPEGA